MITVGKRKVLLWLDEVSCERQRKDGRTGRGWLLLRIHISVILKVYVSRLVLKYSIIISWFTMFIITALHKKTFHVSRVHDRDRDVEPIHFCYSSKSIRKVCLSKATRADIFRGCLAPMPFLEKNMYVNCVCVCARVCVWMYAVCMSTAFVEKRICMYIVSEWGWRGDEANVIP